MEVVKSLIAVAVLASFSVVASPAPVADLSRTSDQGFNTQQARPASVNERLAALERVVEARAAAQLSMQQQLESLLDEVSELRGSTELHSHKLEEILQQQRDIYQEIDRRLGGQSAGGAGQTSNGAMPAQDAAAAAVPAGNPAAVVAAEQVATTPAATADAAPKNDAEAYKQAIAFVTKERNYEAAIVAFENFIKNHPKSERRANAHYWLGQLYFQKDDINKSKVHYERMVKQYPNSERVPDSLFRLGTIAEQQNDAAAAKRYYNQLIKSFPKNDKSAKAKQRLEML